MTSTMGIKPSKPLIPTNSSEYIQSNDTSLTLTQLLDEFQPYSQLQRLYDPELASINRSSKLLSRIQGSLVGLAVGDALGAPVEFRPRSFLLANRVSDMTSGGTWGLKAGQWTDDTSMALCLAASLINKEGFDTYDQLVRYKHWFKNGYMSSTGVCFDIGAATREAITEFINRQNEGARQLKKRFHASIPEDRLDEEIGEKRSLIKFDTDCGGLSAAGNGALMRLAPVPLFYHQSESDAIRNAGLSAKTTHGDRKAVEACEFYAALIWNAMHGASKNDLLSRKFANKFSKNKYDRDLMEIINGSYKRKPNGYDDGIRGKGYVLNSLEAALWAFYNDDNSFEKGVLLAVNLGDDTDTTAAIYGQLAGAYYGIEGIPKHWREQVVEKDFLLALADGLYIKGKALNLKRKSATIEDEGEIKAQSRTGWKPFSAEKVRPSLISESQ